MIATISTKWFRLGLETGADRPGDDEEGDGESILRNTDGDFDPTPESDESVDARFGFRHG